MRAAGGPSSPARARPHTRAARSPPPRAGASPQV
jgi:hypothetical protein